MICTSIQHKSYTQIIDILDLPEVEMAEVRLDLCDLPYDLIEEIFSTSDMPLVATCRAENLGWEEAEKRLSAAVQAGARFADLEIEAPASVSKRFQRLCARKGTEIIRSFHDFSGTPDEDELQKILARCFRYGADIAKVVTMCRDESDLKRLMGLYSVVLEGVDSMQGKLIAFGMGERGIPSRIECLRRGAPFTYACLADGDSTAPGQLSAGRMQYEVYGGHKPSFAAELSMPASKSMAQRAIVAAALAEGTSTLTGYSPCRDSESALEAARALGAEVKVKGDVITVKGCGGHGVELKEIDAGESGLLARLLIPLVPVLGDGFLTVTGHGTLVSRPLEEAGGIMAAFGVLLFNASPRGGEERELHVPVNVKGRLIPGTADVSGKGGSQLISGLLMALPLCRKDSMVFVSEPKSIPYMYMTLDVLRRFGVNTRSEMEGDERLLEQEDWSGCSGISFKIRGGQHYRPADFRIEGDWSAAANFLVAGAVFGCVEVQGLDMKSLQADLSIVDILVEAGAIISQVEDMDSESPSVTVCARKAPLEAFETDLNNSPDLFPIVAVLAAFCSGESHIAGLGRLAGKESDRAEGVLNMLGQMGVDACAQGDELVVEGESLASRALNGRLLKGGEYSSRHDHRMVMALKVASLGASSPVVIDDEQCVSKSFPEFLDVFEAIK